MDPATQLLLACPQCHAPMAHLALQGHGAMPVVVDQCVACRWVWFDALESVNLAGLGWVRLLRELQRSAPAEPAPPRPDALACPVCQSRLKSVHNQTRFGRFPALECPQRHGHLESHSGALAERGLVRPLLPPERLALAKEQRQLHCFNCGARCDGQSDTCSYCASPLMVIDVPRLADALLRKPGDDGGSPVPRGVPLAWPCRGCGHALDPSSQTACLQCGHAVVVPSLIDLTPLLTAIETMLRQAEVSARPYRVKAARPPRTWRDTGLGMLERFWRADASLQTTDATPTPRWAGWFVVALLMFLFWMFRR